MGHSSIKTKAPEKNNKLVKTNYSAILVCFRNDPSIVCLLLPGDLMEFQREGYQHWVVFVGNTLCCINTLIKV